jgi:succinate dehydrogenase / fumarate reductase cytochrome b subunit
VNYQKSRSAPFYNRASVETARMTIANAAARPAASGLLGTTVGKKIVVAVTGVILALFVFAHMAGNLKAFQGAEKFDGYAHFLREAGAPLVPHGGLLWAARVGLLAALGLHVVCVAQLARVSRSARGQPYHRAHDLSFSAVSRTMRWGGVALLGFVVYHLLHLTWGTAHPAFDPSSPYRNVVTAFGVWWVTIPYAVAVAALGLHVYHGLWSTTQTLALQSAFVRRWSRFASAVLALALVAGYLSVPAAVLTGWLRAP